MTGLWTLIGPGVALALVGALALLLRWAFGRGGSLVTRGGHVGSASQYGLLVPVAAPRSPPEGTSLLRRLEAAGLRATLVQTSDGPRVMVFAQDEAMARAALE